MTHCPRFLLLLAVLPVLTLTSARAQAPQYQTDQPSVTRALNDFWALQGLGRTTGGVKANWSALLGSSDWYEWNGLKVNWTDDAVDKAAQRDLLLKTNIDGISAPGAWPAGYVWPSNGSRFWLCPHEHFDQMPRFVCAVYDDYVWSRDVTFLRTMRPPIEAVMGYMVGAMGGRNGLPRCPGVYDVYDYIPVPMQPAGTYRVILAGAGGHCACRAAYEPVARTAAGVLGSNVAFAASRSFSRIETGTTGPLTLSRRLGAHWRPVEATWTSGSGGGVLGFADQPPGSYRLRCADAPAAAYALLSGRYTVTMTHGPAVATCAVPAGGTVRLLRGGARDNLARGIRGAR